MMYHRPMNTNARQCDSSHKISTKGPGRGFSVQALLKKCTVWMLIPALFMFATGALLPAPALALKISLSESADHPKGVEIPPEDKLNPAEPVKNTKSSQPQTPAQQQSVGTNKSASQPSSQSQQPQQQTKKLHGIYELWSPFNRYFPLKNATVSATLTNLLNDKAWSVYFSRYSSVGNYYIEGGKTLGPLKNLTGKFQFSRQLRVTATSNSMQEWSAKIFGMDVRYNWRTQRTSQGFGASAATNVSDQRKTTVNYAPNKRIALGYTAESNAARAISNSPNRTVNKKDTWMMTWAPNEKVKLQIANSATSNWNYSSDSVVKILQTDMKLTLPISKRLSADLGYQFLGNRNVQATGAAENRKSNRSVAVSYLLKKDARLTYAYNSASDRAHNTSVYTNFDALSRDFQLQYPIARWIKFTGQNTVTFSENSGKTAVRQGNLTFDHTKLHVLPGNTSVQVQKNMSRSGDRAAPNTDQNFTLAVATPVDYWKKRITLRQQYNLNQRRTLTPTSEQSSRTESRVYEGSLKITPSLTGVESLNINDTSSSTPVTVSSSSMSRTITDRATMLIKRPFSKRLRTVPTMNYSFSKTRNVNRTVIPTYAKTEAIVLKHSGVFDLKEKNWNGNYTIERSASKQPTGPIARSVMQKLNLTFNNVFGYNLSVNYTTASQQGGGVSSGIFKAIRKYGSKYTLSLSYQFSKSQTEQGRASNTMDRIFELVYEMTL